MKGWIQQSNNNKENEGYNKKNTLTIFVLTNKNPSHFLTYAKVVSSNIPSSNYINNNHIINNNATNDNVHSSNNILSHESFNHYLNHPILHTNTKNNNSHCLYNTTHSMGLPA